MMMMIMHLNFHGAKISDETIQPNFYYLMICNKAAVES